MSCLKISDNFFSAQPFDTGSSSLVSILYGMEEKKAGQKYVCTYIHVYLELTAAI